jgi:predicted O-methyltransferase YrrM
MLSYDALLKLNVKKIMFDVIFIDASHEAIDVLEDAILSWNILNENGIIIFDDYLWDLLDDYHFRPKIAIDSFINIYKTQLNVLYKGYQVIIEKKSKNRFNKPKLKK